jgi:hypothetical protein
MFGWVENVRSMGGSGGAGGRSARLSGLVDGVRSFGREHAARILGWGGPEVDERAKLLSRMIALIVHGLRTKSYEQFVAAYSNPGREPDALKRLSRKASFQLRITPTCWYDAAVSYADDAARTLSILGGGDDFGVSITTTSADNRIFAAFITDYDEKPGRDARAMVRALLRQPSYRRVSDGESLLEF